MATREYERFGPIRITGAANQDYTVPANTKWAGRYLSVISTHSAIANAVVQIGVGGLFRYVWASDIPVNGQIQVDFRHILYAGEVLRFRSATAGAGLDFALTVMEYTLP